jgi:hypothetical protein
VAVPRDFLRRPALRSDERHETDVAEGLAKKAAIAFPDDANELPQRPVLSERNHQTAARRELLEKRLGHSGAARRDHDGVVGGVLGPAERPVAVSHGDVRDAEVGEPIGRDAREILVSLDGVDLAREVGEDGRGIARAGADLQHAIAGTELERRGHQGDDVWLRDRLPLLDRQWAVDVGELLEVGREKGLARHTAHRLQHGRIAHSTGRVRTMSSRSGERLRITLLVAQRAGRLGESGGEAQVNAKPKLSHPLISL